MVYVDVPSPTPSSPSEQSEVVKIELVESGFSLYEVDGRYWEQSVGYVVKNSGNQVAIVQVEFWFVDEDGERVGSTEHRSRSFYVFPDTTVGGGQTAFYGLASEADKDDPKAKDVQYEVHSLAAGNVSDYNTALMEGEVTEVAESTFVNKYETKDQLALRLTSEFEELKRVESIGLVYRDREGEVIGGWGPFEHIPYRDKGDDYPGMEPEVGELRVSPGTSTLSIEALVPPDVDVKATDVFVSPFVAYHPDDPRWKCFKCHDLQA